MLQQQDNDTIEENDEPMDVDNVMNSSIPSRSRTSKWRDRKMLQKKVDKSTILETTGDLLGSQAAKKLVKRLEQDPSLAEKTLKFVERVKEGHENGKY